MSLACGGKFLGLGEVSSNDNWPIRRLANCSSRVRVQKSVENNSDHKLVDSNQEPQYDWLIVQHLIMNAWWKALKKSWQSTKSTNFCFDEFTRCRKFTFAKKIFMRQHIGASSAVSCNNIALRSRTFSARNVLIVVYGAKTARNAGLTEH